MLKRLPDDHKEVPYNMEEDWLETLRKHEGDQIEWLKNNVRDPEFYHRTLLTDLYSDQPGLAEWILDQRECAMGTALYVYLLAMHYDPKDVFDQEWNMTTFRHQRHLDLKLRAAKGLREGRYLPVAYGSLADGPRGDSFSISNDELFDMIRRLPEDHPMAIPADVLDVPWDREAEDRYPWFYNDEVGVFTETYDTWWRRKYGDPKPEPKRRSTSRAEPWGAFGTNNIAPVLGAMAIGVAAHFLRGRR